MPTQSNGWRNKMEDSTFSSPVEWAKARYDEILAREIQKFITQISSPKKVDYLETLNGDELLREAKALRDANVTLREKNLELQALVEEKYDERA